MYEVELKVRADHDAVRERLAAVDAAPRGAVVQRDTYYDAPHRDFAETDEALRVRRVETEGDVESRLTYKGPLVDDVPACVCVCVCVCACMHMRVGASSLRQGWVKVPPCAWASPCCDDPGIKGIR